MNDDLIWGLLDRYFSGASSPDEAARVTRWIGDDPDRARYIASMRRIWGVPVRAVDGAKSGSGNGGDGAGRFDARKAWRMVHERISAPPSPRRPTPAPRLQLAVPARARRTRWLWPFAAAGIAAAAMLWLPLRNEGGGVAAAGSEVMHEYATAGRQRAEILLPDGTRAVLSVRSRLRVPDAYGVDAREVHLEGEAFFDVVHDEEAPFRVYAAGALAEDLGTEFGVRAYPGEALTVVVASGIVGLHTDTTGAARRVTLEAGQLGRWDAVRNTTVVRDVDARRYLRWMEGRLDFDDAPLRDIARDIERWYDVTITLSDSSLGGMRLTASFRNQPLDEVLGIVAQSLGLNHVRQGTEIVFSTAKTP